MKYGLVYLLIDDCPVCPPSFNGFSQTQRNGLIEKLIERLAWLTYSSKPTKINQQVTWLNLTWPNLTLPYLDPDSDPGLGLIFVCAWSQIFDGFFMSCRHVDCFFDYVFQLIVCFFPIREEYLLVGITAFRDKVVYGLLLRENLVRENLVNRDKHGAFKSARFNLGVFCSLKSANNEK